MGNLVIFVVGLLNNQLLKVPETFTDILNYYVLQMIANKFVVYIKVYVVKRYLNKLGSSLTLLEDPSILSDEVIVLIWLSLRFFFYFSQNLVSNRRPKNFSQTSIIKLFTNQSELIDLPTGTLRINIIFATHVLENIAKPIAHPHN